MNAVNAADPIFDLVSAARAAEEAAGAALCLRGDETPAHVLDLAVERLSAAYCGTPTSPAGIASLCRLFLDVEQPDTETADVLEAIERAALALASA